MCCEALLNLADLSEEFYIRCDASDIGIGGILMQKDDGTISKLKILW